MGWVGREVWEEMREEKEAVGAEGKKLQMEIALGCRWGTSRHH